MNHLQGNGRALLLMLMLVRTSNGGNMACAILTFPTHGDVRLFLRGLQIGPAECAERLNNIVLPPLGFITTETAQLLNTKDRNNWVIRAERDIHQIALIEAKLRDAMGSRQGTDMTNEMQLNKLQHLVLNRTA